MTTSETISTSILKNRRKPENKIFKRGIDFRAFFFFPDKFIPRYLKSEAIDDIIK